MTNPRGHFIVDQPKMPSPRRDCGRRRARARSALLAGIVAIIVAGTVTATALLWPAQPHAAPHAEASLAGADAELVTARVTSVMPMPCTDLGATSPNDNTADNAADDSIETSDDSLTPGCLNVRATLAIGEPVTFMIDQVNSRAPAMQPGDTVKLVAQELTFEGTTETHYSFYDYPRGAKMLTIVVLFALIVIAVGRWRGALSLVGVGAAVALLVLFVLPAILSGEPPILVAIVGATGIMVIVLYLAHGISHRTTAALFGSIFGILFTAVAGFTATRWLRFTGIASTEDASLAIAVPDLQMNDVLTATIVIAGLGVLNDITVAQASAVWEMRALNPHLSKRRIYLSAMRVGRDHIASSIYTLVFAYAGAMFVVLLLLYTYPRDLIDLVTTELIGQEIVRTLIGAAGLVLSMPITTAFAVLFAHDATPPGDGAPTAHAVQLHHAAAHSHQAVHSHAAAHNRA